jgi:hypothetical protein
MDWNEGECSKIRLKTEGFKANSYSLHIKRLYIRDVPGLQSGARVD